MNTNTVVSQTVTIKQKTKKDHTLLKSVLFLLPAWILLLVFFVGPILLTFYFAFTNLSLTGSEAKSVQFIGFQNFLSMFQDPNFRISVVKTIVFLLFLPSLASRF